jgi:hypothetical protein
LKTTIQTLSETLHKKQISDIIKPILNAVVSNRKINITNQTTTNNIQLTSTIITTTSGLYTIDPAETLVERPPPISRLHKQNVNYTIVAFLFQTQHHILADLQMYLIRKFAINLVAVELFTDGAASIEMEQTAKRHQAILHSFPEQRHSPGSGPSDRNAAVVNWAISTRAKGYLANGTAILMLDGDVFPLAPFDSGTLLNGHDVVCRKHPALFARFCWIGFICIGPGVHDTIGDFNMSTAMRSGKAYDSGGKTAEYFLKHQHISFAWMKETILLNTDKDLFWGTMNGDIQWIHQNFHICDKCGPEIFFSQFNVSDAVFYHMISGTSEWRFGHQGPRRQALHDAIMKSSYGPNQTYSVSDMITSIKKIQKMDLIPFLGTLTCERVCKG